jgi:hypothetical protein
VRKLLIALLGAALVAGCASGGSSPSTQVRPTTPARMQILQPTPDEVTGPDFTVQIGVLGGKVVKATTGPLTPTEGHVHLTLDGKPYVMAFGDSQPFDNVSPGPHSLQAEFVAKDHAPFTNRPRAFVHFTVQG